MEREMSPIPSGDGVGDVARAALEESRRDATLALIAAEKAERAAKEARKQASWKIRKYERLVQEYGGQMRLPL
jgi:hypothetical protein